MNPYDEDIHTNSSALAEASFWALIEITAAAIGYVLWFWIVEGRA